MEVKSGFMSTEFWFATFLPGMVSLLVLTGVIDTNDMGTTLNLTKEIVMGVLALVTFVTYVIKRTELKKSAFDVRAIELELAVDRKEALTRLESKEPVLG